MPAHEVYQEDWYTDGQGNWKHYGAAKVFTHNPTNPICLAVAGASICGYKQYQYVR